MGESATATGRGRAVGPMPASTRRPGPTGRSGSWPGALRVEATIASSSSGAVNREWPLRWANRRRRLAAGVPWARCRHRGPREGPAWGTHWHSSGETSGSTASGTQLRPQVTAKVSVAVSFRAAVGLLPDLGYPVTPMLALFAWAHDATDFEPSINGVGGACASRRSVWGSSRERWRGGAGRLPDLRISAPSVVACILHRRTTRPIFDHR